MGFTLLTSGSVNPRMLLGYSKVCSFCNSVRVLDFLSVSLLGFLLVRLIGFPLVRLIGFLLVRPRVSIRLFYD